jgi:hypothetical protein
MFLGASQAFKGKSGSGLFGDVMQELMPPLAR